MDNRDIKVTVIVPVYNVELFLGKCIDTILAQSHRNIELILVNDGSTDSSGKICDRYSQKDSRIKVIHQNNFGVSAARNNAIDIATGDYITFVDGDDYVLSDYVEYLLYLAVKYDADISMTTDMFSDFSKKQIKKDKFEIWTAEEATAAILNYRVGIGVYNKMFKKDFLGEKIRFLTELVIGEGFNFNTTAFQRAGKIAVCHKRLYCYRKNNPTSVTTKFNAEKWENGLMAIQYIKKNLIIHTDLINSAWNYANWRTYTDVYDLMVLASAEKEYPELYKKCYEITKRKAFCAFKTNISKKDRIRAVVMMICPRVIPWLMALRRRVYHVNVRS